MKVTACDVADKVFDVRSRLLLGPHTLALAFLYASYTYNLLIRARYRSHLQTALQELN